jgi:orotate phosphoribosyltransferase
MLSYKESLKILKETNALLEGHFILSSGLRSDRYVQCAQLLSKPEKAKIICSSLSKIIKKSYPDIDIILSPALGGVIIGYEIGRQLSINTIFAEKHDGKLLLRRGFIIPNNSKVLIVEDVITTGKSALECAKIVEQNNSKVMGFACIIDRSNDKSSIKEKIVSQVKINIETFDAKSLPEKLKAIEPIKPGSKSLIK